MTLDAFSRRHQAQKIFFRQGAAQRWIGWRESVLSGQQPQAIHTSQLQACDVALRAELANVTDEAVYQHLKDQDLQAGRWCDEDPDVRDVRLWLQIRR